MGNRKLASLLAAAGLGLAALASSGEASAGSIPVSRRSAVGGDLYWWSARNYGSTLPLIPFFHYELVPDVFLDVRLPLAPNIDDDPRFGAGNPTGGVHYASTVLGGRFTWFAGGRVSLPLSSIDNRGWQTANLYAAYATALYDLYLWVPDYLPLTGMGGIEANPIDWLWLRVFADIIVFVPFERNVEGVFQNRFEGEFVSDGGAGGGLAIQAVTNGRFTGRRSGVQLAAEPYFVFDNDKIFLRAGLLVSLNRPVGFGFERGGVLSPHFQFGVHLK